jgi:hypothetical protein
MTARADLRTTLAAIVFLAIMCGCATMSDVQRVKEKGSEGTVKTYPVSADQAWDIRE